MIPGQLIAPGQLTDPGVNFATVHGLTLVTVHMSFSLPRGNFEGRVTRCTTPGRPPCRGSRHLKHDDAFNRRWPPILSIDKCCQVTSLSIERTDHHVLLKTSSCLRCLVIRTERKICPQARVVLRMLIINV